ncbi:MAG: hypothetical protein ACPL3B_07495, partial [Fervidobacterium sp.]
MEKIIVFADDDADGVLSTYILHSFLKSKGEQHRIMFQTWHKFGITEENISQILSYSPSKVYFLDIGSDLNVLEKVSYLIKKGVKVTVLDNHCPTLDVIGENDFLKYKNLLEELKKTGYFEYYSSTETCTTGYVYLYVISNGMNVTPFLEQLTLFGLVADVSTDTKIGGEIYGKLIEKYPEYKGQIYYGEKMMYEWSIIDAVTQFFHVPRRIIYDDAPPLLMNFLRTIEESDYDFIRLYMDVEKMLSETYKMKQVTVLDYPEPVKTVLSLIVSWRTQWKEILERGNIFTLDYKNFQVNIVSHEWNLG